MAACQDKKLLKDFEAKLAAVKENSTINFDRILVGKMETRSFPMTNTSLLPVAFEVMLGDLAESKNMSVFPLSGVIPVNGVQLITLTFSSIAPLLLTGKFSIRYADNEGGLNTSRALTRGFAATAEAYEIQAVSLSAEGKEGKNDGGNEVNFGALRVGDYATQTLNIGNKGKYKIGYRFLFIRPAIGKLIKILPMMGEIEPEADPAKIHFVFCSPTEAMHMVGNKHIHVQVITQHNTPSIEMITSPLLS